VLIQDTKDAKMKNNHRFRHYFSSLFFLAIVLEVVCFIVDLSIPRGYTKWILYFFPLLLIWNTTSVQIITAVTFVSILQVIGFILSPPSIIPVHVALTGTISSLLIFWIISLVFISRIKYQSAQVKSERQYKQLIEAAKSIVLRWEPSGKLLFINHYGLQFFGYTEEEILGKNVMILVPEIESSGRDLTTLIQQIVQAPDRFITIVNENVRRDRTSAWVSWTNNVITDESGQVLEILAVGNDVTELKRTEQELRKSEERLRLAAQAAQLGIFDWDIQNDLPLWDRRMYEIFGVNPVDKPINREVFVKEVIHPEDLQRFNREISESMRQGSTFNGSYRIRRRNDRQVRWIQYFGKFELSEQKIPVRLVSTLADITERKEAEQELKKSEEHLRILNENLETLVVRRTEQVRALSKTLTLAEQRERKQFSNILHENIQQKLFGARMLLKQYLRDLQTAEQVPQKEDVEDGIRVLEQALTTTKALSIELNPPVLSTEGLDAALRWLVTHMAATYGLKVDLKMYGNVEKVRNGTQHMLSQMIREILNNVKEHAGVMNAVLTIVCKGGLLTVTINDSGRGFNPAEVLQEKVDESRLGLRSIKERLKLFNGDLTINSVRDQGTSVMIKLPCKNC
jgi:PAS domain S-box-containing protein